MPCVMACSAVAERCHCVRYHENAIYVTKPMNQCQNRRRFHIAVHWYGVIMPAVTPSLEALSSLRYDL